MQRLKTRPATRSAARPTMKRRLARRAALGRAALGRAALGRAALGRAALGIAAIALGITGLAPFGPVRAQTVAETEEDAAAGLALARALGVDATDVAEAPPEAGLLPPFGAYVAAAAAGSPAAAAGLQAHDVIFQAGETPTIDAAAFHAALVALAPGAAATLQVSRPDGRALVTLSADTLDAARAQARRAGPTPETVGPPVLRIDSGGHMSKVGDIVFFDGGAKAATAGNDKTVRIWDVATATSERVLRGAIGPGAQGRIFAIGVSPDESVLAAAGWLAGERPDRYAVRLIDLETGTLKRVLRAPMEQGGHGDVVLDLAFAPDGRRLATASFDRTAVIWDLRLGLPTLRLTGHAREVTAVVFTRDGARVATGSDDGRARLFSALDGRLIAEMPMAEAGVTALAVSPDGAFLAVGDEAGDIALWDARTGAFIRKMDNQVAVVGALAFSPDGTRLVSTCGGGQVACQQWPDLVWNVGTGEPVAFHESHENIVLAAAHHPSEPLIATAGGAEMEVAFWDAESGALVRRGRGVGRRIWAVGFSEDGRSIGWGSTWPGQPETGLNPVEWSLALPVDGGLFRDPAPVTTSEAFRGAQRAAGSRALTVREGGEYGYPAILELRDGGADGKVLQEYVRGSAEGFQHLTFGFTPDGRTIVSGAANGGLTAYDPEGGKKGEFFGHDGDVRAIAVSPDGRLLLSGSVDQTLKLWNVETRELILTLFHGEDGGWAAWTPQGVYDGSFGAQDAGRLIGWQLNHGPDRMASHVRAAQLGDVLRRPRIVARAVALGSAKAAFEEARAEEARIRREIAAGRADPAALRFPLPEDMAALLAAPPPELRLLALETRAEGVARISVAIREPGPAARSVEAFIGDPFRDIGFARVTPTEAPTPETIDLDALRPGERAASFDVPLRRGENEIRLRADSAGGRSALIEAFALLEGEGPLDRTGALRILAIGVDDYAAAAPHLPSLRFAGRDAARFAESAARAMGPLHASVETRVLVNGGGEAPTKAAIEDALDWLSGGAPTDTAVLFLAGHGEASEDAYHFLPTDHRRDASGGAWENALPWARIRAALGRSEGRRILFVDACRSADAFHGLLQAEANTDGVLMYSSTSQGQLALEAPEFQHGLFTYAVLEGLDGAAFDPATGRLTAVRLDGFVTERVLELSRGAQEPVAFRGGGNLLLASR